MPNRNDPKAPRWNIPTHTLILFAVVAAFAFVIVFGGTPFLRAAALTGLALVFTFRRMPPMELSPWPPPANVNAWPAPDPTTRAA